MLFSFMVPCPAPSFTRSVTRVAALSKQASEPGKCRRRRPAGAPWEQHLWRRWPGV